MLYIYSVSLYLYIECGARQYFSCKRVLVSTVFIVFLIKTCMRKHRSQKDNLFIIDLSLLF